MVNQVFKSTDSATNLLTDAKELALANKDLKIIERLLNYRKNSTVGIDMELQDSKHSPENGWLFNRDACEGVTDKAHRTTYIKYRLLPKGIIDEERAIYKNSQGRTTTEGLLVYRLKRDINTVRIIFLLFYTKGKIWDVTESDYFNDNIYRKIRSNLVRDNPEVKNIESAFMQLFTYKRLLSRKKIKVSIEPNIEIYLETLFKLYARAKIIPPTLIYNLLTTGIAMPKGVKLEDLYLSFLIYDYYACNNDGLRKKLMTAITTIKKEGGK